MTSVLSAYAQIPTNKMYINIGDVRSTIYDTVGIPVTWTGYNAAIQTALASPGAAVFRDMGKTVYLYDETNISGVLRKIQYIPQGANGVFGTGAAASGSAAPGGPQEYYTGYIRLGGMTYGGGDGIATAVARIN